MESWKKLSKGDDKKIDQKNFKVEFALWTVVIEIKFVMMYKVVND